MQGSPDEWCESDGTAERRWGARRERFDAISCHRFRQLGLDPARLGRLPVARRLGALYGRFVARVPFESLSNERVRGLHPDDATKWARGTDRFLRDHCAYGLGGTSFELAYALRDLLHGAGANAHCVVGRNLLTDDAHAAVLAFLDRKAWLYDATLLLRAPVAARAGAQCADRLGTLRVTGRKKGELTVGFETAARPGVRPLYSLAPVPAPPQLFRQAWMASFARTRHRPLRLARRVGSELRLYIQRPERLEFVTPHGRRVERIEADPAARLHDLFGIDAGCLRAYFQQRAGGE